MATARRRTPKNPIDNHSIDVSNWRNWKLKIGLGVLVTAIGGLGVLGHWGLGVAEQVRKAADERYLLAQNYRIDRLWDQQRELQRDRRAVNDAVHQLQSKQRYQPRSFGPADRDLLRQKEQDLREIDKSIKSIEEQRARIQK